jgi:hypothetical protein
MAIGRLLLLLATIDPVADFLGVIELNISCP